MVFREVSSKVNLPEMEEKWLAFWREHDTYRQSLELRRGAPNYVFYEGPPTANGRPGTHHVLARVFKDLFPRYHTMKGEYCYRKGGWDTHGLPVELEIEKELGFSGKKAIEDYGIAEFNAKCKESVFRYVREWEKLTDRIAFWIDMDNPYVTLSNDYIESVWWILRQLWDKELLYQGFKVVPYCPRCGTPLSDHEVALGYRQADDPSIYVKFPLKDKPGTYFLVWTTTPWTLPGNAALAVGQDVDYVVIEQDNGSGQTERLILAEALLPAAVRGEYKVVEKKKGRDLRGLRYQPLYTFLPFEQKAHYVILGDFVSTEDGTGIVHIAPAFGAEDMEVGKEYDLPVLQTVDLRGRFIDAVTPWRGMFVKDADPLIIEDLQQRGLMYHSTTYTHTYPFCWRCDTPLLYYAKTTWYVETTRVKDRLVANNQKINWYPAHIKDGRFGNWLENNVDWALGRERYWGTPLPVWQCQGCGQQHCIGGFDELRERAAAAGYTVADGDDFDPHRPFIDEVPLKCDQCGDTMRRVPEVIDCWFDSGAMPIAQYHYPFGDPDTFKSQFPADFISEAIDQTRGWFYSLHAISTLVFDEPCFLNCVCLGHIQDAEGHKMSKSRGNVIEPWQVIEKYGADALRWFLYTATPVGNSYRFAVEPIGEVVRKFLLTLWNTYTFFVTYANIDGFDPLEHDVPLDERSDLDRWVLSELNLLVKRVDEGLAAYDVTGAARPITAFVDDLSNWYVRRSRRRFWRSEEDRDKVAAYLTLWQCLTTLAKLLAPFTPFIAEELYQNLVRSVEADAPESVHLCDFPVADEAAVDEELVADTRLVQRVVSLGHAARNRAGIKVRQPLARVVVRPRHEAEVDSLRRLSDQILDELNVKTLNFVAEAAEVVDYHIRPQPAVLGKKYGARFPHIRAAVAGMDQAELARRFAAGETVEVTLDDGTTVSLAADEVDVQVTPKGGYAAAEEAGYLVAITTELTDELVQEGLARELVRRIQTMRKDAGFRIEDTIVTYYQASPALKAVLDDFGEYIKGETLSTELVEAEPPAGAYRQQLTVDGEEITLGLVRKA